MKRILIIALWALCACTNDKVQWVSSTFETPWQEMEIMADGAQPAGTVVIDESKTLQTVEGFGTCFNELGWRSLSLLSEADRTREDSLGFLNPDGRVVLLLGNQNEDEKAISIRVSGKSLAVNLPASSVNTIVL